MTSYISFLFIHFQEPSIGDVAVGVTVLILLILSAFASGSEVAFFSLNPSAVKSLKEKNTAGSEIILDYLNDHKKLLATVLIANNFVNIGVVILAGYFIDAVVVFEGTVPWVEFLVKVVFLSFMLLLFGEILPKIYAANHALSFIHFVARPLQFCSWFFSPLIKLLMASSRLLDKRLKKNKQHFSMDDLSHALELTHEVEEDDKEILEGIIKFGNITVEEIKCSRLDIVAVSWKLKFPDIVKLVSENVYSRIPVYDESIDNISGILYVKDLLAHLHKGSGFKWQSLVRSPLFVPGKMKINDLLKEFQRVKKHMAIVVDEYGGTTGVVTLEDILEEIVGEISDETDELELSYEREDERSYIFDAKTLLNDFVKVVKVNESLWEESKVDADSLGGLMLELKGDFPAVGEVFEFNACQFEVLEVDDRRVKRVRVVLPEEEHED